MGDTDKLLANAIDFSKKWVQFTRKTSGRDKLYRVVQYYSRFANWYLLNHTAHTEIASRLKKLESAMSTGRKLFRLGQTIDYLVSLQEAMKEKDPMLRTLGIIDYAGRAGRMLFDNYQFAMKTGVLKGNREFVDRLACICWLIGLLVSLTRNSLLCQRLMEKEEKARKDGDSEEAEKIRTKQHNVAMDIVRELLDCPSPLFALGYTPDFVNTGLVGLTGGTSGVIGVFQIWWKTFANRT